VEQRFRSLEDSMAKRLGVPPPNATGGAPNPAPSTGKPAKK
jgi:hypothetical protein